MQSNNYDSRESQVRSILNDINSAAITFENFKRYLDKVSDADKIINANIDNMAYEYNSLNNTLVENSKKDVNVKMRQRGYVPVDDYNTLFRMNEIQRQVFNWKSLQVEILQIIYVKLGQVLEDTKGMEIQRDALSRMDELQANNQKVFKENFSMMTRMVLSIVNGKMQAVDDKFIKLVTALFRQSNSLIQYLVRALAQVIEKDGSIDNTTKDRIVKEFEKNVSNDKYLEEFEENLKDDIAKGNSDLAKVNEEARQSAEKSYEEYFKDVEDDDEGSQGKPASEKRGRGRPPKNDSSQDDIDKKMEQEFEEFR